MQMPQVLARLRQYAQRARQEQAVLVRAPVIFICGSVAKSVLLESFVHQHMRFYAPHELINIVIATEAEKSIKPIIPKP